MFTTFSESKKINREANKIIEKANIIIDIERKKTYSALNELGRLKANILAQNIKPFIEGFKMIKNIDSTEIVLGNESTKLNMNVRELEELHKMIEFSTAASTGFGAGAVAGTAVAYGAYTGTMMFGAASTGTAISALSGAAASNATLAFLGGGSLASGGFGMAGGMMVLGGLVTIPALAVLGIIVSSKAKQNKEEAFRNLELAKDYSRQIDVLKEKCRIVQETATLFNKHLYQLKTIFEKLNSIFLEIIRFSGIDWKQYTAEEKRTIAACLSILKTLKVMVAHDLLDNDGSLRENTDLVCQEAREVYKSCILI